ncbi:CRAL-TRIO domain [Pseudocohnilembus persalinus]|uniref:CRAL-TRIO domain n=1 Tax=Pseudocohnilembus persalinus TaxID=266149 RepID=A0A0V0R1W6_PSEPJ|nr:CRAL-TRIO domain [Pseudocohnilembus persalinus]|eukprot:KRX08532.1 CRAL-TRIO domain [Pseudocohnilembus persalinus]
MIKENEKIQDINNLKNQLLKQLQIEAKKIVPDNKKMYIPKYLDEDNLYKTREYDLIKAKQMWKKWVEWRIQYNIDQLDPQNFIEELKTGKAFLHKWDKEGNVIVIIQIRKHNPNMTDIQKEFKFQKLGEFPFYMIEKLKAQSHQLTKNQFNL